MCSYAVQINMENLSIVKSKCKPTDNKSRSVGDESLGWRAWVPVSEFCYLHKYSLAIVWSTAVGYVWLNPKLICLELLFSDTVYALGSRNRVRSWPLLVSRHEKWIQLRLQPRYGCTHHFLTLPLVAHWGLLVFLMKKCPLNYASIHSNISASFTPPGIWAHRDEEVFQVHRPICQRQS